MEKALRVLAINLYPPDISAMKPISSHLAHQMARFAVLVADGYTVEQAEKEMIK